MIFFTNETILVYKYPRLSREEMQKMLNFTYGDLKQTRFYQDVFGEGKLEEARALVTRQLTRRFGPLSADQALRLHALNLEQVEILAEALLDFTCVED